jgi:adenosylcobyric acid synthase
MGQTNRKGGNPLFQVVERNSKPTNDADGCVSTDSKSMGTYIHGLFDNPEFTRFWLNHIGLNDLEVSDLGGLEARNREYDLLAEYFEKHIDIHGIMETVNITNELRGS